MDNFKNLSTSKETARSSTGNSNKEENTLTSIDEEDDFESLFKHKPRTSVANKLSTSLSSNKSNTSSVSLNETKLNTSSKSKTSPSEKIGDKSKTCDDFQDEEDFFYSYKFTPKKSNTSSVSDSKPRISTNNILSIDTPNKKDEISEISDFIKSTQPCPTLSTSTESTYRTINSAFKFKPKSPSVISNTRLSISSSVQDQNKQSNHLTHDEKFSVKSTSFNPKESLSNENSSTSRIQNKSSLTNGEIRSYIGESSNDKTGK